MKKNVLLLSLAVLAGLMVYGCNSGSSSSGGAPAPVYIPAGTYTSTLGNLVPVGSTPAEFCSQSESTTTVTVNSSGEVCSDASGCLALNVSANPCFTEVQSSTINSITLTSTISLTSCSLNSSNIFNSTANISVSGNGQTLSCVGTVTMAPLVTQ